MTYFVISPKILECCAPSDGQVDCAITYGMEEYGIHRGLAQCQFRLAKPADGHEGACIRVNNDQVLASPLYDLFWRGFCMYVMNTLRLDVFSEHPTDAQVRKFYLPDVQFDTTKNDFTKSSVKVERY